MVKTDLAVKVIDCPSIEDLPIIMVEIGSLREPKTRVAFLYREYTSYITGLGSLESQEQRLDRTLEALKILTIKEQNSLILGDINVDHSRLQEPGYHLVSLARKVVDFQAEQGYSQLVTKPTREQMVNGVVRRSLLDVVYSNMVEKVLAVHQDTVGRSDHQGVRVSVATRTKFPKGQCVKKRLYKNFDPVKFLYEIQLAEIDAKVCGQNDLQEAARVFGELFGEVLEANAPTRTIQMHRNYNPHLTERTKYMIKERRRLQNLAKETDDPEAHRRANQLAQEVKIQVRKDKRDGARRLFGRCENPRQMWGTARTVLGMERDKGPTSVLNKEGDLTSGAQEMADEFNEYFIKKSEGPEAHGQWEWRRLPAASGN